VWCARQAGSNVECAGKALPTARHAGCGARPRCSKTGLPWPLGLDRWWDMRASLGGGANSYPQDGRVLVGAARWRSVSWTVSSIGIRQGPGNQTSSVALPGRLKTPTGEAPTGEAPKGETPKGEGCLATSIPRDAAAAAAAAAKVGPNKPESCGERGALAPPLPSPERSL